MYYHFDEIFHSLRDLSIYCSLDNIFIPLLKHFGKKVMHSEFEETTNLIEKFSRLVECGDVYKLFKKVDAWKLVVKQTSVHTNIFFSQLIPEVTRIRPIVDYFFEPFIYKTTDVMCRITYVTSDLRRASHKFNSIIKRNNELMYNAVSFLIKKDEEIKKNFINYLRDKYLENKDRMKTVFDKHAVISDGFAVNFNYFLLLLCGGIFRKKIMDFDLGFFEEEEFYLTDENFTKEEKRVMKKDSLNLQTSVFLCKTVFLNYSFNKIMENYKDLEIKLDFAESANVKDILNTYINAYRLILSSDIFKEEKTFIDYLSEYLLLNLKNKNIPDLVYNSYFNAAEYISHFLGPFNFPNKLIETFIYKKLDLIKVIYFNFNTYDINTLIKLYVFLENKDLQIKTECRFYLTKLLVKTNNFDAVQLEELVVIRFYSYIINELETTLGKMIQSILTLKRKMKETNQELSEMMRLKNEIQQRIDILGGLFDLLDIIDLEIYLNSNLLSQFTSVINHNLKRLIGPNCNELSTKEINIKIDFKEILRRVLKIYLKMSHNETFINNLVSDKINFNLNLLKRAYEISKNKFILNESELKLLEELIEKINKTISEVVNEEEIVPEEFIDPLTCVMMETPVILNGSKVSVDKSTYDMLVIGQMNDPFNREELTGFIINNDLKKKIDEFKSTKLNKN